MKIAYQGIQGAYSHKALEQIEGEKVGLPTFHDVYEAVSSGKVDLGLLPIENSLIGTIYETIDLLAGGDLKIVGEIIIKIDHCLLALPGAKIQKVLSHPKALAQCTRFFKAHPEWEIVPHYDTAGAAHDIAMSGDRTVGAIASEAAAKEYGLEIIQRNVQDHEQNYTRFFLISKTGTSGNKGSLCFTLDHAPGKLVEMLDQFAKAGMNLTHIVSRPIPGKPFEYLFYVDLEGPQEGLKKIKAKYLG
ncbi:MAG: prephenate dehydratase, partial [Verrucomicrobia bacterium]|nr:prephenate dehydratase [Verrucomicrobiota bacterium]